MPAYQQGDVFIQKIDELPSGERAKVEGNILALGEASGHKHIVRGVGAEVVKVAKQRHLYIVAPKPAEVAHLDDEDKPTKEHEFFILDPGTYVVRPIKEVDHFAPKRSRIRPVAD